MTELNHCNDSALTVLWTGAAIASAIFGLLIYSIASFRKVPHSGVTTFARNTAIEVVWAMIPMLILISTAMPSIKTLLTVETSCSSAKLAEASAR